MGLQEQIEKLRGFQGVIIVEGIRDKAALQELGISNILYLKGPLYKVIDSVVAQADQCIILTDLDQEGKKLYASIKKALEQNHIKVNDTFRNFLFKNTTLRQIEGLLSYLKNHEE